MGSWNRGRGCSTAQPGPYLGDGRLDSHGMDPGHGGAAPLGAACVQNRAGSVQGPTAGRSQELLRPFLHCLPCCAFQRQPTAECTHVLVMLGTRKCKEMLAEPLTSLVRGKWL